MPKSLLEYADWLAERDLIWPQVPAEVSAKATAFVEPLDGVRAVVWNVYGTLLRISDGRLLFDHPKKMRMQIAMDKTVEEFKMWHSMNRKPGNPGELMYEQYAPLLKRQLMANTQQKGDSPEVDAPAIWRKLLSRLAEKGYSYDINLYGDPEELSDKVTYFFHSSLQGVEAAPNARDALTAIVESPLKQSLLSDAQSFTLVQMLRALRVQGTLPPLGGLFSLGLMTLSFQDGLRKPSASLFGRCVERFEAEGIEPREVLYISNQLRDDLSVAKQAGMQTALYAADTLSLRAAKSDVRDPDMKPDRLLTDLIQIRDILSI